MVELWIFLVSPLCFSIFSAKNMYNFCNQENTYYYDTLMKDTWKLFS